MVHRLCRVLPYKEGDARVDVMNRWIEIERMQMVTKGETKSISVSIIRNMHPLLKFPSHLGHRGLATLTSSECRIIERRREVTDENTVRQPASMDKTGLCGGCGLSLSGKLQLSRRSSIPATAAAIIPADLSTSRSETLRKHCIFTQSSSTPQVKLGSGRAVRAYHHQQQALVASNDLRAEITNQQHT
ncbi:hypothetical protein U9M48_020402 [Paspalum notatum var. saurae]|uniref:Uncharacterized protein n=1 Tax=Paspalum notatum var. saurae TaxID=547442 RepID=A0AAQ3TG02_PASNO